MAIERTLGQTASRRRSILAGALVVPLAAWALVRLLGLDRVYPLVPLVAFTPYAALASLAVVAVVGALRVRWALVFALVTTAVLGAVVAPRAFPGGGSDVPDPGVELTVMTANLHFGGADAQTIVDLVSQQEVDVLSVQELTPQALRGLHAAGLDELLTHAVTPAEAGASGGGLYAREPLDDGGNLGRVEGFRQPSAGATFDGIPVALASVHPVPPTSPGSVERWRGALRELPAAGEGDELGMLLGDFNATLDNHELRRVIDRGYVDAADAVGAGLATTWRRAFVPPITIDHLLVDERVHVAAVDTYEVPHSEHHAVVADLVLPAD